MATLPFRSSKPPVSSSALSTATSMRLMKKLATLATRETSPALGGEGVEAGDEGAGHGLVGFHREEQRHVDADAVRRQRLNRRNAFLGGRHLHHEVVARHHLVETTGLGQGLIGVEGEVGRDLQADIAVGAVARLVDRAQHVGGGLDVGDRAALVEVDDPGVALVHHGLQGVVVLGRAADRLLEDRGVGGDAAQAVLVHQGLELPFRDEAPGDEVEPHGLALFGKERLERVHENSSSSWRRAESRVAVFRQRLYASPPPCGEELRWGWLRQPLKSEGRPTTPIPGPSPQGGGENGSYFLCRAIWSRAAASTFSGVKPNFVCRSLIGPRSEGVHADDAAGRARVAVPADDRALLDGDPRQHLRDEDAVAVSLVLALEEIPGGIETTRASMPSAFSAS